MKPDVAIRAMNMDIAFRARTRFTLASKDLNKVVVDRKLAADQIVVSSSITSCVQVAIDGTDTAATRRDRLATCNSTQTGEAGFRPRQNFTPLTIPFALPDLSGLGQNLRQKSQTPIESWSRKSINYQNHKNCFDPFHLYFWRGEPILSSRRNGPLFSTDLTCLDATAPPSDTTTRWR
jgi:hypothetical protein